MRAINPKIKYLIPFFIFMFFFIRLLSIVLLYRALFIILLYRALAPPGLLKEYVYHILGLFVSSSITASSSHRFIASSTSFVPHRVHGFDVHGAVGRGDASEKTEEHQQEKRRYRRAELDLEDGLVLGDDFEEVKEEYGEHDA